MKDYKTKRERHEVLRGSMETDRATFLSRWRDLGDYILPSRPRFFLTDTNRGERKNQKIIDSTATMAARTLRSGLMSGVTSPARPWFRLTTPDPSLAENGPIKEWLYLVSDRMNTVFLRSNLYNSLPILYGDIGVFGTGAMLIEEDFTGDVIRTFPLPIGSYFIANDEMLQVRSIIRDFRMTARQLVGKFGRRLPNGEMDWSNFSNSVKYTYLNGDLEAWFDICHVVGPNPEFDPKRLDAKYKRYESCYFERGAFGNTNNNYMAGDENKYLRESGFDYFPVLAPRWEVSGEDVYGTDCPGMTALGDIKQLQLGEKKAMQAIEKGINPPLVAPPELLNKPISMLPGGTTYASEREGTKGIRSLHEVNLRLADLENKQAQVRRRISRAFFEDLFLMLASSDRRQITAREIDERHEEKLLALGPVLEQLNQDLLDPLIDITFSVMERQGMIPEPPEELQGMELKVEYVSIMAQAQKMIGVSGLERFISIAGQVVSVSGDPTAIDKVNVDQFFDEYGNLLSVPPSIIRSDEHVAAMRAQRAKAHQAAQMAQQVPVLAKTAKDLSDTDTEKDSALKELMAMGSAGGLG